MEKTDKKATVIATQRVRLPESVYRASQDAAIDAGKDWNDYVAEHLARFLETHADSPPGKEPEMLQAQPRLSVPAFLWAHAKVYSRRYKITLPDLIAATLRDALHADPRTTLP